MKIEWDWELDLKKLLLYTWRYAASVSVLRFDRERVLNTQAYFNLLRDSPSRQGKRWLAKDVLLGIPAEQGKRQKDKDAAKEIKRVRMRASPSYWLAASFPLFFYFLLCLFSFPSSSLSSSVSACLWPYQIEEKIGQVAYRLKLPPSAKVHSVFHMSLFEKKVGDNVVVAAHFPPTIDPHNPRWYPAYILDRKIFRKGNVPVTKWSIQWMGVVEEATWEEAAEIMHRFPDFGAA
ncbi:hypothetical protein ACLB2K_030974 [Fragaria x ananassa]